MNALTKSALNEFRNVDRADRPIRLVLDNDPSKARFERIAIVGLGYVGLPLAICLSEKFEAVAGFDISEMLKQRLSFVNPTLR